MLTVGLTFLLLVTLIFLGFPIYLAICIAGTVATLAMGDSLLLVATNVFGGIDSFTLMAIPLFILAGFIMMECRITDRVVQFSDALVGRFQGGLGHVNVLSSMFFGGIQGSGVADASAIGSVMIPAMERQGYHKDYAVAVTAASAAIGPIIPPSVAMIMFAYYTRLSVGKLFLGGLLPGILFGLGLMAVNAVAVRRRGYGLIPKDRSLKTILVTGFRSSGALIMPLIIIFGIVGGIFTPTESGAAAVLYGLLYGFASGNLRWKRLPGVLINAANTTAIVMIILAMSKVFANVMVRVGFQDLVITYIIEAIGQPHLATLVIMGLLISLGLFLDPTVLIAMFAMTVHAVGQHLGFDPIHYGVLMVITMLLGAITPPVGSMLFVSCSIADLPIEKSVKILLPFIMVLFLVAVAVLFVPGLVLWVAGYVS